MWVLLPFAIFLKITLCELDKGVITSLEYSHYRVQPVIVNGSPAEEGEVPFLVSIKEAVKTFRNSSILWKNLCGGTIINETKVLTAAHCFELSNFFFAKHPDRLRIVAGTLKNDLIHAGWTETTEQAQWRKITKLKLHQHFSFPYNDVALVFVDKPWSFSDTVDYIVPARKFTDYPKSCFSAGFGRTTYSAIEPSISPVMLIARIQPLSRIKCSVIWETNMNDFICTHSLVSDVGVGDSGGPLACVGTSDPVESSYNRLLLVGVVSGKNFDRTTLFTRVSRFASWIESDGRNTCAADQFTWCLVITWFALIYLVFHLFICVSVCENVCKKTARIF